MTSGQVQRQKARKHGRYTKMNKCEVCGVALGSNYRSHPNCNSTGLGLVLCNKEKCYRAIETSQAVLRKGKCLSAEEGIRAKAQHTRPCQDCPFSRDALPGWLGSDSSEEWIRIAHGETLVECHVLHGAQCAGVAIYRANVAKLPKYPTIIRLQADREAVFAAPKEFLEHHNLRRAHASNRTGAPTPEESGGFTKEAKD